MSTSKTSPNIDQNNSHSRLNRAEIQAAFAKAAELRAIHAALLQSQTQAQPQGQSSPCQHPSCPSPTASRHSAQDYPVFTPTYDEDSVPKYQKDSRRSIKWEEEDDTESIVTVNQSPLAAQKRPPKTLLRKGLAALAPRFVSHSHTPSAASSLHDASVSLPTTLRRTGRESHLNHQSELQGGSTVSSDKCKPLGSSTTPPPEGRRKGKHAYGSALFRQWGFLRPKKRSTTKSVTVTNYDSMDEWIAAVEVLEAKLQQANRNRDAAVEEVTELRCSLNELENKLRELEVYCQDLKVSVNQRVLTQECSEQKNIQQQQGLLSVKHKQGRQVELPVSSEAMVEGFLQMVSEARVAVKHLCRSVVAHIQDVDGQEAANKFNALLQPYNVSVSASAGTSKVSRAVMFHLEALLNQVMYEDFENCSFEKNGPQRVLDVQEACKVKFDEFASLRNLRWSEVVNKGTRYYSDTFSAFCDQKMGMVVSMLKWTSAWPEPLLQSFFIASKCVWLVHLLAFSFTPPLSVFRVHHSSHFDPAYMDDILCEKDTQRPHLPCKVRIMVMPGFYVHDHIVKCKVLCRYKTSS